MKVLILGCGKIGFGLAKTLSLEENDVTIVDESETALKLANEKLDVKTIRGHASDINVLKEAGIKNADLLIAATNLDEVNIVSCQIADILFDINTKISRINKSAYYESSIIESKDKFPIDFAISPISEISRAIRRIISIPGAIDVVSCMDGLIKIICVKCREKAPLAGVKLKFITTIDTDSKIAVLYIKKKNAECIIPSENDEISSGDDIYFACRSNDVPYVMSLFGILENSSRDIVFLGSGNICQDIIPNLSNQSNYFKIVEADLKNINKLSESLDNVEIIQGDILDVETLRSANVGNAEMAISITDDDRTNVLAALISKKLGCQRTASVLNDLHYSNLQNSFGINTILDPALLSVTKILHFIKSGGIENVLDLENDVEIFAIEVEENSHAIGLLIEDIISKNETYVIALLRNKEIKLMPKMTVLHSNDKILFISKTNAKNKLLKLFNALPKYLA